MIFVTPLLNLTEAKMSMKSAIDFIDALNGTVVIETLPSWYAFFTKYITGAEAVSVLSNFACEIAKVFIML